MEKTLLTPTQVAEIFNVGRTTVWRWQREGLLVPRIKLRGRARYTLQDLARFAEQIDIKPATHG